MTPNTALEQLRRDAPLVHCITNYVAMNIAANVLSAAGASPAMIHAAEEVADFVPLAGALTVNIGTLSAPWLEAMMVAAQAAGQSDTPWVLDPVAHFATPYRAQATQDLLRLSPAIIRGNASEILALGGGAGQGKGVDSGDSVEAAAAAAMLLAQSQGCVVVVSGEVDFVTDGARGARITGGSALMPKVTALGCSLTALMGAYCAVAGPMEGAIAACVHFAEAGSLAEVGAAGPGSFAVAFLDQLHTVEAGMLDEGRVSWL